MDSERDPNPSPLHLSITSTYPSRQYEILRSSPNWNQTLWLIVFDDSGAIYDHMVPPQEGVPAPDAPCNLNEGNIGCPNVFGQ